MGNQAEQPWGAVELNRAQLCGKSTAMFKVLLLPVICCDTAEQPELSLSLENAVT